MKRLALWGFILIQIYGFATVEEDNKLIIQAKAERSTSLTKTLAEQNVSSTEDGGSIIVVPLHKLPADAKPLELVLINHGKYTMGLPTNEISIVDMDWPHHQVTITKDYYVGKYEITQGQWLAVMGSKPPCNRGEGENYPVYNVSWNECQTFIQKLNQLSFGSFRLPTEAEWEYACRAGTTTRFSFGNGDNWTDYAKYIWWKGNSAG